MVAGRQAALAAAAGAVKWLSREGERASERAGLFVSRFSRAIVGRSERASALSLLQQGGLSSSALLKGFSGKSSSKKWCFLWSFSRVGKRIHSWGSLWKKRRRRRKRSRWRF
jgi:hypothetical protein